MPVLILLGVLGILGAVSLKESCTKPTPPLSGDKLGNMLKEMAGKSKKECRKILRKYRP